MKWYLAAEIKSALFVVIKVAVVQSATNLLTHQQFTYSKQMPLRQQTESLQKNWNWWWTK
jgi:hypothetical protein